MSKRLTKTIWYGSDVDSNGNPILPSTHGGLDGLNYGELYLHLSNGKASLWTLYLDGKIVKITGGGSDVDMSSYLLKSIWDKVFEIRTDSQGKEYIFGKLPMVTQYGITMYSGGNVDIPSLASGLPFDGRTIWYNPDTQQIEVLGGTGGGSGEGVSNFWDLSGIPSWITNSKPKYTYTEIEGTPDLSGYATESWVLGKSYITSATLGTELGKYVTLDTDQPLKGKKDFKNGLSIDGLELRKSQDDVVYIDANLVVRGGVTMYAQNEVDIPSIIDSIPTASTTVKGIASFDGAYFSVVNGKVSLISSNVGLNEEELYNYLTSNNYAKKSDIPSLSGYATESWVNTKLGGYLPLSGGTLTGNLNLSYNKLYIGSGSDDFYIGWGSNNCYVYQNYYGHYFTTKGERRLTIDDSGNVGIGDTNPTSKLGVKGNIDIYNDGDYSGVIGFNRKSSTGGLFNTSYNGFQIHNYKGDLQFFVQKTNNTELIPITIIGNSGNVGIGTTNPAYKLDVNGAISTSTELIVNGGKLKYDSAKKYWKLEGDLLVTGGVTMYGNEGTYTPSTIMDALLYDDTTLGINSNGQLYVKGGTSGGGLDITALQNYLTQNSYLNVTSGDNRYLKLSGGTLTGTANVITINRTDLNQPCIAYEYNGTSYGSIGLKGYGDPFVYNGSTKVLNQIYHNGNISTLKTDLGLGSNAFTSTSYLPSSSYTAADILSKLKTADGSGSGLDADLLDGKQPSELNVGSATKLQTARTIWGQSFDGTKNVSGNLYGVYSIYMESSLNILQSGTKYLTSISTSNNALKIQPRIDGTGYSVNTLINPQGGNVGIGTTNPAYKLHVEGTMYGDLKMKTPRTIWGQSFDGTDKVDGSMIVNQSASGDIVTFNDTRTTQGVLTIRFDRNNVDYGGINWFHDGYNGYAYNSTSHINIGHSTGFVSLGLWTSPLLIVDIAKKCVGVNTTTPEFALDVNGSMHSTYIKSGDAPAVAFPNYINSSSLIYKEWHTFVGYNGKGFIFGHDSTDSSIARLSIYGGDTTMSYLRIENAVEVSNNSENGSAVLRMCMSQTGTKDQNPNIEFMKGTAYIDWHYAGDTSVDYTTRLIEGAKGILTLKGGLNIDTTLSVTEDAELKKRAFVKNYITFSDLGAIGGGNTSTARIGTFDHSEGGLVIQLGKNGTGSNLTKQRFEIINPAWDVGLMWVDRNGNMFVNGGITMYSDQHKKTILNHVELSLKQIADAPLIEHYYNSDENKTTHVGSIAQYWASMNDWFCKLDSEGYYTMEIQNAALASAISIARELDRYETKTDKAIKKLKMRICELEEEVERLKSV